MALDITAAKIGLSDYGIFMTMGKKKMAEIQIAGAEVESFRRGVG